MDIQLGVAEEHAASEVRVPAVAFPNAGYQYLSWGVTSSGYNYPLRLLIWWYNYPLRLLIWWWWWWSLSPLGTIRVTSGDQPLHGDADSACCASCFVRLPSMFSTFKPHSPSCACAPPANVSSTGEQHAGQQPRQGGMQALVGGLEVMMTQLTLGAWCGELQRAVTCPCL
jgi:hypothetical protein